MRVHQLEIENFRGIAKGMVVFPAHGLLVGPNNVGKSTVLEALDLVLGPDRLSGATTIDEHDFYMGDYLPSKPDDSADASDGTATDGDPQADCDAAETTGPQIAITVTLTELTDEELTRFRGHVEVWNAIEMRVYTHEEAVSLIPTRADYVLRIRFRSWYELEDDEFQAETVFMSPQFEDGTFENIGKRQKQSIGFLYLRALRTARRAATLQRGSLLDILLNVTEAEPRIWQDVLDGLSSLGEATSREPGLRGILDELERAMGEYVPGRKAEMPPSRLNVTQLTREQLRTMMTYFMTDRKTGHLLPFDRLGSGTTNLLVLALLTLIAERKRNVIFAMEEPEVALGPTVQRRIISKLKAVSTQALVTSHSPYVAEQMLPDNILVLRRDNGELKSRFAVATPELKEKILRQEFRKRFAEGLLGNAVVIVEGDTEMYALPVASDVLAGVEGTGYRSLDVLGVIPVCAGGDGELAKVASFFSMAGIATYVYCDKLNDRAMISAIQAESDGVHEHPHKSFELLLSVELALPVLQQQLKSLATRTDYPSDVAVPQDGDEEAVWRDALRKVLDKRKGHGYAALLLKNCQAAELPDSLRKYLGMLHVLVAGEAISATDPLHALLT
jgi:putative ATP-dependent endonuclease of OLD family